MTYTKVPNDLMEVLLSDALNDSERRILVCIARQTYGFNKEFDQISLSQFQKTTHLSRMTVIATIKRLVRVGLVKDTILVNQLILPKYGKPYYIDLNDYQDKLVKLSLLVKYVRPELVKLTIHTKENNQKKVLSKDNRSKTRSVKSKEEKQQDREFIDHILKCFKDVKGHAPTDKDPRQVAWNTIQRLTTLHTKRRQYFDARSKTVRDLWDAYWSWIQQQKSFEGVERLETVKLKMTIWTDALIAKLDQKGGST